MEKSSGGVRSLKKPYIKPQVKKKKATVASINASIEAKHPDWGKFPTAGSFLNNYADPFGGGRAYSADANYGRYNLHATDTSWRIDHVSDRTTVWKEASGSVAGKISLAANKNAAIKALREMLK